MEVIMKPRLASATSLHSEAAWNEAADRVERYLRAHRVAGEARVARLTADVITIARARSQPGVDPVETAMHVLESGMSRWFERVIPSDERDLQPLLARGRVALDQGDVTARWPEHFLRNHSAPAELVRTMHAAELKGGPEVALAHMAPREPVVARNSVWQRVRASMRWPFFRMITGLTLMLTLVGITVAAHR